MERELETKYVPIGDIKPYKNNAKKHDAVQVKNVAESIRQFGWAQPIVVDKNNVIIIGHCRYSSALLLGLVEVPVAKLDWLTDEQVKKLRNLDNKLNESEWDFTLLEKDIEGLDFSDFDIDWDLPKIEEEKEREEIEVEEGEYQIIIDCETEEEQEMIFEKLQEYGIKCRVSTL